MLKSSVTESSGVERRESTVCRLSITFCLVAWSEHAMRMFSFWLRATACEVVIMSAVNRQIIEGQ